MAVNNERIAVFGGTFDPPHIGHFSLAEKVLSHEYADRIIFVPALSPPHKPENPISAFDERMEMLRIGIEATGENRFSIDGLEGDREEQPSYTFDTMVELSRKYPDAELLLLIGGDSLSHLHTWYRAEELIAGWLVLTYPRKGRDNLPQIDKFWPKGIASLLSDTILPFEMIDVSSTEIRKRIQNNENLKNLVFPEIIEYINRKGLYKSVKKAD